MTKERPILFSGAMVRAILDGRKTQTRRVFKLPSWADWYVSGAMQGEKTGDIVPKDPRQRGWYSIEELPCPYGQLFDRLWVRETWAQPAALDPGPTVYRADYPACVPAGFENIPPAEAIRWKPSIHMPRGLSRILLEITGGRVERLQDITDTDSIFEGIGGYGDKDAWTDYTVAGATVETPRESFRTLWQSINGAGAWEANPWVWVLEFRRV
ncbi:MAG: hypothetical protein JO067_14955 [Cupriavidus sp.]|nr:hypothetical protein [Cupriavidus sp.]